MDQYTTNPPLTRSELQQIDGELQIIEAKRSQQLLGITATDAVSAAYRETVTDMVTEVRLARRRISDGSYGSCRRCERTIPRDRLEWRPWATTCTECAPRR